MNKNKKGFTLIEILVVIGIIALVTAIAVPSIMAINKKMKQKSYDVKIELLEKSAVNYSENNSNLIKEEINAKLTEGKCNTTEILEDGSGCYCKEKGNCQYIYMITAGKLVEVGAFKSEKTNNISCDVINPIDSTCIDEKVITIRLDDENKNSTAKLEDTGGFENGYVNKCPGKEGESSKTLFALGLCDQVKEEIEGMFNYTFEGYRSWHDNTTPGNSYSGDDYKTEVSESIKANPTEGLYSKEDDYGTSYYFRGSDKLNNIVQFGSYNSDAYCCYIRKKDNYPIMSEKNDCITSTYDSIEKIANAEDKMYWRIIRINGDGTLKLIYTGTKITEPLSIGASYFAQTKGHVSQWYNLFLKENYDKFIVTHDFFEDTKLRIYSYYNSVYEYYGTYDRFYISKPNPSLKTHEEGIIDNSKVGVITADEVVLSGFQANGKNHGYNVKTYLPVTDSSSAVTMNRAYAYYVNSSINRSTNYFIYDSILHMTDISIAGSVFPVINLSAEYVRNNITGSGTLSDPFKFNSDK